MIRKRKITINSAEDFVLEQKRIRQGKKIFMIQAWIFLFCCLVVWRAWWSIFSFVKTIWVSIGNVVAQGTKTIVWQTLGTKPKLDEHGNINVALIGYGWDTHAGWYLTDAMIIVSINPEKGTMAMLSIPRDLYVKHPSGSYGKINSIFAWAFTQNKKNYDLAAPSILGKLTEITGIPLSYYAFIDFKWFETFLDSLWWITIDVPEPIYDSAYPGPNNSYITFSIQSGTQTLDGATALKYARSRHSTSDYSRSRRQQEIIQGILDKILSSSTLPSPSKMDELYKNVTSFVHTNVAVWELLWWLPYSSSLKKKSSRQVAACGASRWESAQAWCLLYTPPMEAFGGASVQLPSWATPSSVSNYTAIKSFVADTMMNTDFLADNSTIRVQNGINTWVNKTLRTVPIWNNVAVDLVKAWFRIFDVGNAPAPIAQTTVTTNGPWRKASIEKVRRFFPNVIVTEWAVVPDGPSLTLTIGDDYASGNRASIEKTLPLYLQY